MSDNIKKHRPALERDGGVVPRSWAGL